MLKKISTFLFLAIAVFGYSQEKHDSRLLERYTAEELTSIQNNDPKEYEIIVHALKVGISIGEHHGGKDKEIVIDGILDKDPTKEHTYISLGIELIDRYQYFMFKGTNTIVVVRPKHLITQIK